jgi:hypothetical protein
MQPDESSASRRFVILRHEMPAGATRATHWDFMIENGETLRTWALEFEPAAEIDVPAMSLADHRRAYLEYEGPVSGDRGHVSRWDAGQFRMISSGANTCQIEIAGARLQGRVQLTQTNGPDHWTFRFSPGSVATPR